MKIQEMELNEFLSRNNINKEDFKKCELDWVLIQSIGAKHQSEMSRLDDLAESYAKTIQRFDKVHSVRWRIKDPEHLMEKIVRKTTKFSGSYNKDYLNISVENYFEMVTDLIGIRALHLFKQDCVDIITSLESTWEKAEPVTAYIRKGDNEEGYEDIGTWKVKEHKAGYRSIHFVFSTNPYKSKVFTEVQIRTIFEEGWSEIDHKIRYPNFSDNKNIAAFLDIFNRLAGSADEMGSFVKALSTMISKNQSELQILEEEKRIHQEKIKNLLERLKQESNSNEVTGLVHDLESELAHQHLSRSLGAAGAELYRDDSYVAIEDNILTEFLKQAQAAAMVGSTYKPTR